MKREHLKSLIKEVIRTMVLKEYVATIKDPETGEDTDIEVDYDYYHGSRGRRVGMARFAEPDEPAQVVINSVTMPDGRVIDADDLDEHTREKLEDEIMSYHQDM